MGRDRNPDGVNTYPASQQDLDSYRNASRALLQLQVPLLVRASNPHERLFVAGFDGTGNSMYKDAPGNQTNVADIVKQIRETRPRNIVAGYVEGPGTQDGWAARTRDLITGATFEARVEEMYEQFSKQAKIWIDQDPDAKISLASTGFSRGAEEAAAFARLVHERGIQDPTGAIYTRDRNGQISSVEFTKPALVPPGKITQAIGLFDPVATGDPGSHNRTLPPSVISGFQITAEDERRDQFKSTNILDPGFTEQRHFLNVTVGGAHSDIGGGYLLNGMSIRSGNAMADYLNGLSDRPFLEKRHEPIDPKLNVVHRSEEHQLIYTTRDFDRSKERVRVEDVDNPVLCQRGVKRDCWNKDPLDPVMDRQFEHRTAPIAPSAPRPAIAPASSAGSVDEQPRREQRGNTEQTMQPGHPDYALFAALKERMPAGLPDGKIAQAMLQAKQGGIISAARLDQVIVQDSTVFMVGHSPGFRARVDLSAPAPSMQDTLQQSRAFDEQRAQQLVQSASPERQPLQQQTPVRAM